MSEQIITKRCSKCKEIKPLSEFYKHRTNKDGHYSQCKKCCINYKKQYEKTESGKLTAKRYRQSEKGKDSLKRRKEHYRQSEKGKSYTKRYNKYYFRSEKGKLAYKKWKQKNPLKFQAHNAVQTAIRSGKLPRSDSLLCSCGNQAAQYHHHKGYAPEHWLDVVPACLKCHKD